MKTATRNRIGMVLLLLLASTSMAFSQGLFKIIEGLSDQSLKATMETNVNAMMMAMNTAANQNAKTVKLNKDNFTSEAIKDIEQMWKSSAIFCPPVNIMSRCLKTSYGYQVRGIPVDLKEAEQRKLAALQGRAVAPLGRPQAVSFPRPCPALAGWSPVA